jgi:hypothetical protein
MPKERAVETRQERTAKKTANGRAEDTAAAASKLGDRVSQTAEQTWTRARESVGDLRDAVDLQGRVDRHPYGTLAAALGVGYLLGGGLFTPFTGRLVGLAMRIGLRLAVLPVVRDELMGLAESLAGAEDGGVEVGGGSAGSGESTK